MQMNEPETKDAQVTPEVLQALSDEFDALCQKRHAMGEEKYGAGTWLGTDPIAMAIEELIDMANYFRFAYIKMRLMQEAIGTTRVVAQPKPGNEMMGKDAFVSFSRD